MSQFLMPSLGADMEAGTLIEWLKKPGDKIARGEIIAVVETQKGAIEIEAFEDGMLGSYLIDIGAQVPVGTPLATILTKEAAVTLAPTPTKAPAKPPQAETAKPASAPDSPPVAAAKQAQMSTQKAPAPPTSGARQRVTPAARRQAAEKGIDLSTQTPGPDGIIALADLKAGDAAAPLITGMREAIAAAMSRSKREIPHYYLAHSVDITAAETFVSNANKNRPPDERLLIGALYLKAVAKALARYPELNGHFLDGRFRTSAAAHLGVATNIRSGGLIAPAIHDVQTLTLDALMARLRDLVSRVRAGRFRARELSDATITVTSLGDRGVDLLYGVINPPQVAIVGFGTASERPWVLDGKIKVRRILCLTLAADHRVSDGHRGALFLNAIARHLQTPEEL